MANENMSPDIEDELSKICLRKGESGGDLFSESKSSFAGSGMKNSYSTGQMFDLRKPVKKPFPSDFHSNKYSANHTVPCRPPNLSTAKRAQNRSVSSTLKRSPDSLYISKNLHGSRNATNVKPEKGTIDLVAADYRKSSALHLSLSSLKTSPYTKNRKCVPSNVKKIHSELPEAHRERKYSDDHKVLQSLGVRSRSNSVAHARSRIDNKEPVSRQKDSRFKDIPELLSFIYNKDPTLFSENLNDLDFKENPVLSIENITARLQETTGPLKVFENGEILRKKDIYFAPNRSGMQDKDLRTINVRNYYQNYGFDDERNNYIVMTGDHVNYRYEISKIMGNGSFGNVLKCKDHKYSSSYNTNKVVAIKVIKNDTDWSLQAVSEIKILKYLKEKLTLSKELDLQEFPIMNYLDHFNFRSHMCIVSEMLSLNLYTLLEITDFRGFSFSILRNFARQILKGLQFIHSHNVIHCDIKPENIMIKLPHITTQNSFSSEDVIVKLIDFGSSCFVNEISHSYIQSRFYRAPEVILGSTYSNTIDIWSFGCVMAELFSGSPLLPGKNEYEQIGLILELFGAPSSSLVTDLRSKLVKSVKSQKTTRNIDHLGLTPSTPKEPLLNEKVIKRTLLFQLFDLHGKIDLNFLNLRINASTTTKPSPRYQSKRKFVLNSKNIDVLLRLHTSREQRDDTMLFTRFLRSMLRWNPNERLTSTQLLLEPFLNQNFT